MCPLVQSQQHLVHVDLRDTSKPLHARITVVKPFEVVALLSHLVVNTMVLFDLTTGNQAESPAGWRMVS